jgi:hypothetical protein
VGARLLVARFSMGVIGADHRIGRLPLVVKRRAGGLTAGGALKLWKPCSQPFHP